jgi:Tfp pilus assembly protein PilO
VQVKTKNLMIGAVVVLLVGLLWYTVVYSPMEAKASKAKTAAHEADKSVASLRQAINGSIAAKKGTKSHDVSTETMLAAIPVGDAEASFLRSVDALRVASGADWQSITPTPPTASGTITTINVGITVQGTEAQLLRYASGLYDLKRIFLVDNMSITAGAAGAAGSAPSPAQMQISGRIFSQPSVSAATGGTTGAGGTTPVTGAPAPTGGATAPAGVQNN